MFGPAIFAIKRQITKNMKLGDYNLLKGAEITFPYSSMNKSEIIHENVDTFDIHRFNSENSKKIDKMRYIPFSVGIRNCIG